MQNGNVLNASSLLGRADIDRRTKMLREKLTARFCDLCCAGVPQDDATHWDLDCFVEEECGGAGVGPHVRGQCTACFSCFIWRVPSPVAGFITGKGVDRNGRIN